MPQGMQNLLTAPLVRTEEAEPVGGGEVDPPWVSKGWSGSLGRAGVEQHHPGSRGLMGGGVWPP